MASLEGQFLKALIERFSHPGLAAVLENMPDDLASKFKGLPDSGGRTPESFFLQPKRLLEGMHPSWCDELVLLCPTAIQPLMRTIVLDAFQKKGKTGGGTLTEPLRQFLLEILVAKWPERSVLEMAGEEGASFPWLASCDEQAIFSLAQLLGVNDVVDVVRRIVEKKTLQKILFALTPMQQRYLRSLLHRSPRSATLNKELAALLQDDPKMGAKILLKQGLEKLAVAMKDEPGLLVFHVMHHIDREQAFFLKEVMEKKVAPGMHMEMKKNLSHAYQFLQKAEE